MKLRKLVDAYRVDSAKGFRLGDFDPEDTHGLRSEFKTEAKELLEHGIQRLTEMQEILYAQDRWALLLIFQALDAAGKDGTIKHVMSGVNPQGVQVYSFKAPSAEELDHDYLWRTTKCLPERGRIGIFNRSYYEEVLVVRVHPELLQKQHIPDKFISKDLWQDRFEDINAFERYLYRNGVMVRKFFLHVSKKEQKKRFLERLENPAKNWKFSGADLRERDFWDKYQKGYEDMIRNTASEHAPWYVVPADNKWFTRMVVAGAVVEALDSMNLSFPKLTPEQKAELQKGREELEPKQQGNGAKNAKPRRAAGSN